MLQFRVLALTATPGGDAKVTFISVVSYRTCILRLTFMLFVFSFLLHFLQSVQSVVSNLLISHIELRSDESPDIRAYSHQRSVEKVVVPLGEILSAHQARYLQVGTIQVAPCNLKILFGPRKLISPSEFKEYSNHSDL